VQFHGLQRVGHETIGPCLRCTNHRPVWFGASSANWCLPQLRCSLICWRPVVFLDLEARNHGPLGGNRKHAQENHGHRIRRCAGRRLQDQALKVHRRISFNTRADSIYLQMHRHHLLVRRFRLLQHVRRRGNLRNIYGSSAQDGWQVSQPLTLKPRAPLGWGETGMWSCVRSLRRRRPAI